ncbi:unnamed protein product [Linum trigynum]|uniref:Uncharacterized protein n=1 Tax=Linum trigynum TaxID=586398 RepID=A0AAV2E4H8_9ROSI
MFNVVKSTTSWLELFSARKTLKNYDEKRQAVPLSRSEKCIVGTGLERQVALDSGATAIAEHEGRRLSTVVAKFNVVRIDRNNGCHASGKPVG